MKYSHSPLNNEAPHEAGVHFSLISWLMRYTSNWSRRRVWCTALLLCFIFWLSLGEGVAAMMS